MKGTGTRRATELHIELPRDQPRNKRRLPRWDAGALRFRAARDVRYTWPSVHQCRGADHRHAWLGTVGLYIMTVILACAEHDRRDHALGASVAIHDVVAELGVPVALFPGEWDTARSFEGRVGLGGVRTDEYGVVLDRPIDRWRCGAHQPGAPESVTQLVESRPA